MIKNKRLLIILSAAFLSVEAILGVLLQTAQDKISINLRYTAIIAAALFCALFFEKSAAFFCTQTALVCTLCADYFLVCLPELRQLPAMIFFSVAQMAYFVRIYLDDESRARRKAHIIVRAAASAAAIAVTLAVLRENADAVAVISMFYYVNLILNAVFSMFSFKKNMLFSIGLALFVLCDFVIGFSFIGTYLPIAENALIYKIIYPGFDLAWAFYLPSQALIAISLLQRPLRDVDKR